MGSTVFADAAYKIYLDASPETRLQRRYKQLKEKGFSGSLAALREEMESRDERDASRKTAPMKAAADAITIDTSDLDIDQVVQKVLDYVSA